MPCSIVVGGSAGLFTFGDNSPVVSYSCIANAVFPGEGNISEDPLFVRRGRWEDADGDGIENWLPGNYHLQPGSPCIDRGTCEGAPLLDLDGNPRPTGAGCDMGAYEFGSCPPPRFRRGDSNDDGAADMSDAISTLGFLFLGNPRRLGCEMSADSNDSGDLDPPFPDCGVDSTADDLRCAGSTGCS